MGVILDGCPPRLPITRDEVQMELDRRRPGQSRITTPRDEADSVEILSGVDPSGVTLGTPISMIVRNKDQKSGDYLNNDLLVSYRPSHADATYDAKYGVRAIAGGGRSSARETIGRVAAGAVAKKILDVYSGVEVRRRWSKARKRGRAQADLGERSVALARRANEQRVPSPSRTTAGFGRAFGSLFALLSPFKSPPTH